MNLNIPVEMRQFIIFGIIGLFNTLFDLLIWELILKLIKDRQKLNEFLTKVNLNSYSFSQGIAFVIANIVSYFLNKNFTFEGVYLKNEAVSMTAFFTVSIFSMTISVLLINFLTQNETVLEFSKINKLLSKHWPLIMKLGVISVTMFTNFIGYKLLVF